MVSKSFRSSTNRQPLEFEVEWADGDGELVVETFHAKPQLSAIKLLKFAEVMAPAGEGEEGSSIVQIGEELVSFLEGAMVKADRERFSSMINDPDKDIDISILTEIGVWLAGVYSGGRPTGPDSEDTSSETSGTGVDSTPGPSPAGTTYSRPETPVASLT